MQEKKSKHSGDVVALSALKDRTLSWTGRIAIALKLWHGDKYIPRKEEVLIDWLTFTIHSKGDVLLESEKLCAWQALAEILNSNKVKDSRGSITVPLRFYKDIQDCIQTSEVISPCVIDCLLFITTDKLCKTFTYVSLDDLVDLLVTCCRHYTDRKSTSAKVDRKWSDVFSSLLVRLDSLTDRRSLPVTVRALFANKLFVVGLSVYRHLAGPEAKLLMRVMLRTLVHVETLKHYERYLKENTTSLTAADSKSSSIQKRENFVSSLFTSIAEGLMLDEESMRKVYLEVLSQLFEFYLKACEGSSFKADRVGMLYSLIHLTDGMKSEQDKLKGQGELFKLAAQHEVHNITSETAKSELTAFTNTMGDLLNSSCWTNHWYTCVTSLLDINHKSVEKHLPAVLAHAWQRAPQAASWEIEEAQAKLLIALMNTYCKLRQLPKLVNLMVQCIMGSDDAVPLPPLALHNLGEVITASPPTLCYDLWLDLYTPLLTHTRAVTDEASASRCLAYAEILHTIMYQMRLYDSNVPLTVRNKMVEGMVKVQADLSDEMVKCTDDVSEAKLKGPVLLLLVDACSAVSILLSHYVSGRPSQCLLAALDLIEVVKTSDVSESVCCLCQLLSVRLSYHHLSSIQATDPSDSKEVNGCVAKVLSVWRETSVGSLQPWSNTMLSADNSNIATAILHQFSHSSLIYHIAQSDHTNVLAFTKLLLDTGLCCMLKSSAELNGRQTVDVTCGNIRKHQTASSVAYKSALQLWVTTVPTTLRTLLVQETLLSLASTFHVNSEDDNGEPSTKRRRKSLKKSKAVEKSSVMEGISSYILSLRENMLSEEVQKTIRFSTFLADKEAFTGLTLDSKQVGAMLLATTVLSSIPLRGLTDVVQRSMCSISLMILRLTELVGETLGEARDVASAHTLLFAQLICSPSLTKVLPEFLDVELVDVLGPLANNKRDSCMRAVRDVLIKLICSNEQAFKTHKEHLTHSLSSLLETTSPVALSPAYDQLVKIALGVIKTVLQPSTASLQPTDAIIKWVEKRTRRLVEKMLTDDLTDSTHLTAEHLQWCGYMLRTHRKTSQGASAMGHVLTLVMKELSSIVNKLKGFQIQQVKDETTRVNALLQFISCAIKTTHVPDYREQLQHSSGHLTKLWLDLMLLAGKLVETDVVDDVISSLVTMIDMNSLTACIDELHGTALLKPGEELVSHLLSTVHIWSLIISMNELSKDKQSVIEDRCQQFIVDSQGYICQVCTFLKDATNQQQADMSKQVLADHLKLLSVIASKGKAYCSHQCVASMLMSIQLVKLRADVWMVSELMTPLAAIQQILKAVLLHHQNAASYNVHLYAAICTKLVMCIITFADQSSLMVAKSEKEINISETALLCCCQELHKVFSTMAEFPNVFSKVACFVLADVVHHLKSITLLPNVKKSLYLALNGLFDVMDDHCEVMLKINLDEASREIYKTLHNQYNKYHKYTGKV